MNYKIKEPLKKFLIIIINTLHILICVLPILIYFIPKNIFTPYLKWILLLMIMVPLHWIFFGNKCILTIITKYLGDYDNKKMETNAEFTENYLKIIYKPLLKSLDIKWNNDSVAKLITVRWIINILLVWYYIFYISPCAVSQ